MLLPNMQSLGFVESDDEICEIVMELVNSLPVSMKGKTGRFERGKFYILSREGEPMELWAYCAKGDETVLDDFFFAYHGRIYRA